jgi:predicted N-acetyltransferase YhbS
MNLFARLKRSFKRLSFIDSRLRRQLPLPFTSNGVIYRFLGRNDSVEELTALINSAYTVYKKEGLDYKGVSQNSEDTIKRLRHSYTIVALEDNKIIGTISYKPPWECRGSEWFNKPGVAKSNQLAVDPDYQSKGIGRKLIDLVELFAILQGAKEIASDHAEEAVDYIEWKKKQGYRFVAYHNWSFTNYRSVILSKNLDEFNT